MTTKTFKGIRKIPTLEQYRTLVSTGTVTIDGTVVTYDDAYEYIVLENEFYTKEETDQLYVKQTSSADKIYGTDSSGEQVVYDKNSFGQVDDVKVNNISVVNNKIANIDLSGYVPTSRTVNGHALSANVTVTASDVGLGNVVNTGDSATPTENGTTKFTTGGAYTELAKKVDKTTIANVLYGTNSSGEQTTYAVPMTYDYTA